MRKILMVIFQFTKVIVRSCNRRKSCL